MSACAVCAPLPDQNAALRRHLIGSMKKDAVPTVAVLTIDRPLASSLRTETMFWAARAGGGPAPSSCAASAAAAGSAKPRRSSWERDAGAAGWGSVDAAGVADGWRWARWRTAATASAPLLPLLLLCGRRGRAPGPRCCGMLERCCIVRQCISLPRFEPGADDLRTVITGG